MKPLSQVLDAMPTSAPEKNSNTSLTPQAGSGAGAGKTLPALTEIRDLLASKTATPEKIDASLKAALQSSENLSVSYHKTGVYHREHGFLRTREVPNIDVNDKTAVKELYLMVRGTCAPCPKEDLMKEIYAMSLGMARRKDQDDDFKMMVALYANDLVEYPRDVVIDACREMRRELKFFPTISDLRDECESRFEFRRSLMRELENIVSGVKYLAAG